MKKYNNGNSISLDTISEEELEQAFKEFSEGNEHLEKLLKECYREGVATTGSHAGPTGHHKGQDVNGPYLELDVKNSSVKIKNILNSVKDEDGFKIQYHPDSGPNPFGSINNDVLDFDNPSLAVGFEYEENEERINSLFDKMTDSLKEKEIDLNGPFSNLLDIFQKFTGKVSGVYFKLTHYDGSYLLWTLIDQGINNPNAEYLKSIFSDTGMIFDDSEIAKENETKAYLYELKCEDVETLGKVISNIKEKVKDLQIDLPSFESEEAKKLKPRYRASILKKELLEKYGASEKTREEIEKFLWQEDLRDIVKKYKDEWYTDEEYKIEKNKLFTKYKRMARSGNFKKMIAELEKKYTAEYDEILRDYYGEIKSGNIHVPLIQKIGKETIEEQKDVINIDETENIKNNNLEKNIKEKSKNIGE